MSTMADISMRALLVAVVFAVALLALFARGSAPGVTFALENDITLTIASQAFFKGLPIPSSTWALKNLVPQSDKFFNIAGVMPGDSGEATITAHVEGRQSAWLCLDFSNLQSNENGLTPAEIGVDPNGNVSGELADGMQFFAWRDNGDNVFEVGEQPLFGTTTRAASVVLNAKSYPIADSTTGEALPIGSTRSIGIAWCAGHLAVDAASAHLSCDGASLGNAAQSDSFSVDVSIRAASNRDQPFFMCAAGGAANRGRPERDTRPTRPIR